MRKIKFKIKFRAWHKKRKKWLEATLHLSIIDGLLWWQLGYSCEVLNIKDRKNIILTQFTGLLDHNGKEIYEGDIIKITLFYNDKEVILTRRVKFKKGCFCVDYDNDIGFLPLWRFTNVEIVGNIFENPEYLKEEV